VQFLSTDAFFASLRRWSEMDIVVLTHQNITCLHHDVKVMTSPHTSPETQAPGQTTLSMT
jgi:hypothetical protein